MCGIVGVYNISSRGLNHLSAESYREMSNSLYHRGPDEEGSYLDENIWLGFRRLSIIDLNHGHQPIFNEDKSILCICNGEIFNYKELTGQLKSRGHLFRTNCDVEVLVHAYEEWGLQMVERLNGQFAFVIYDKRNSSMVLVRDQVGICPLFYTVKNDVIIFASEIKAILNYPGLEREVNLEGLDQIFCLPGLSSPVTMFKNIHALKPGHLLQIRNGEITEKEYWDLDFPKVMPDEKPESYYLDRVEELLSNSVRLRLNADVPLGLYISGGLDSSIITNLVRKEKKSDLINSFGIAFGGNSAFDERKYQQLVAKKFETNHHEIEFDIHDIQGRLRSMIYCAESPLKETYNTCCLALSEMVRSKNIKVVLSGEGADEAFAGYVGHKLDKIRPLLKSDLSDFEQLMEAEIREKVWGDANFQYERNLYPYQDIRRGIYSKDVNSVFDNFNCLNDNLINKRKVESLTPLQKRTYLDFKLRLGDHLLGDHGDRVTYSNSIEGRYPFLDIDLLEFSKIIPDNLKLNNNTEKYILKQAFRQQLPPEIFNREKFGFVAPGARYLINEDIEWINDLLSYNQIKRQGYFNPDTVARLVDTYKNPAFSLSETFEIDLLMIIITFQIFLEEFKLN